MGTRELMRRYLLGRSSPEERIDLENRYLANANVFDELTETENDLIDSYVRGKLSGSDERDFELQYLGSAQRRARIGFAGALAEVSREPKPAKSVQKDPFWRRFPSTFGQTSWRLRWGLALGAMAMVISVGWLLKMRDHDRQSALSPAGGRQSPATSVVAGGNTRPSGGGSAGTEVAKLEKPALDEFTVQLTAGTSRSAGALANTFGVPSSTSSVSLQMILDNDDYPAYTAVLETAEGKTIQRTNGLKSQTLKGNKVVILRMPSRLIQPGDYIIRLSGTATKGNEQDVGVYSFRAVNK
jgi:hypothetical protein